MHTGTQVSLHCTVHVHSYIVIRVCVGFMVNVKLYISTKNLRSSITVKQCLF